VIWVLLIAIDWFCRVEPAPPMLDALKGRFNNRPALQFPPRSWRVARWNLPVEVRAHALSDRFL